MLDNFDCAFVINLTDRRDRRRAMERQLSRVDATAEFFPAIRPPSQMGFPSIGAAGCFLSHLEVLRTARSRNVRSVLVMEDDLNFSDAMPARWRPLTEELFAADWSFFYAGHILRETRQGLEPLPSRQSCQCSHFVAINGAALARVIAGLEGILSRPPGHVLGGPMHVDGAYSTIRASDSTLTTYAAFPSLGFQRSSRSDIAPARWYDRLPVISSLAGHYRTFFRPAKR
jgi:glycosyl transferase family 25